VSTPNKCSPEVYYFAVKRVIAIFECPDCGVPAGTFCAYPRPRVDRTCPGRIPINFSPRDMVQLDGLTWD